MTYQRRNIADLPHYVYRHYNVADQVIYIGCTNDPTERFRVQRNSKDWWTEVTRTDLDGPMPYAEAVYVETCAIRAEWPIHNRHMPRARTLEGIELHVALFRRADVERLRDELEEAKTA